MSLIRPRGYTCPICGAKDWCAISVSSDGTQFYICPRYNDASHAAKHRFSVSESEDELAFTGWKPIRFTRRTTPHGTYVFRGETDQGRGRYMDYDLFVEEQKKAYHGWVRERLSVREEKGYPYVTVPYNEKVIGKLKGIGARWAEDPLGSRNPKKPEAVPRSWRVSVSHRDSLNAILLDAFDYLPDGKFSMETAARTSTLRKIVREAEEAKVKEAAIGPVDKLDRVYGSLLHHLILEDHDRRQLKDHDRWPDAFLQEVMLKVPLRSLPPADHLRQKEDGPRYEEFKGLKNPTRKELVRMIGEELGGNADEIFTGVPGFYKNRRGEWVLGGSDGYLIPEFNAQAKVYRLRIRLSDNARKEIAGSTGKEPGKYQQFSSAGKDCGCPGTSQLGFYGLWNAMKYIRGGFKKPRVIVCEGEKKGIVAAMLTGYLIITLPGVMSYRLLDEPMTVSSDWSSGDITAMEWLMRMGVERICLCNDMDMVDNDTVMRATFDALTLIKGKGFIPEVGKWDKAYKGLDDALLARIKPSIVIPPEFR